MIMVLTKWRPLAGRIAIINRPHKKIETAFKCEFLLDTLYNEMNMLRTIQRLFIFIIHFTKLHLRHWSGSSERTDQQNRKTLFTLGTILNII